MEPLRLDHERLDVYQCAIEFFSLTLRLLPALPRGEGELRDQLRRAALSIPLNIAEGTGKATAPDRHRFYVIARGSALECAAILDVGGLAGWFPVQEQSQGKELVGRLVAMLTKMSRGT